MNAINVNPDRYGADLSCFDAETMVVFFDEDTQDDPVLEETFAAMIEREIDLCTERGRLSHSEYIDRLLTSLRAAVSRIETELMARSL